MRVIQRLIQTEYALTLPPSKDGDARELKITTYPGPAEITIEEIQAMQEGLDRLAGGGLSSAAEEQRRFWESKVPRR